jgi:septal ring factor EnvC (AmiA/AmiB activator)
MSVAQLIKLVETLGVPVLVAAASAFALWKVLQFILRDLRDDIKDISKEQTDELRELRRTLQGELQETKTEIQEIKTMVVRLIDRVRMLDQSLVEHTTAARIVWGVEPARERKRTREDRRAELLEELRGIGK